MSGNGWKLHTRGNDEIQWGLLVFLRKDNNISLHVVSLFPTATSRLQSLRSFFLRLHGEHYEGKGRIFLKPAPCSTIINSLISPQSSSLSVIIHCFLGRNPTPSTQILSLSHYQLKHGHGIPHLIISFPAYLSHVNINAWFSMNHHTMLNFHCFPNS